MKTDNKTIALIAEVKRRKEEISRLEKPNWKTNCSFSYTENSSQSTNLHTEMNVRNLLCMAAFLKEKERAYIEVAKELEVEAPPFTWAGYPVDEWLYDIKTRINKIQITSKKKKLEQLEERLNKIISPEKRAELELQDIMNELDG